MQPMRIDFDLKLHMPVAQKVADELVFRRLQGEGVEFVLNRTSLTPPLNILILIFLKLPI